MKPPSRKISRPAADDFQSTSADVSSGKAGVAGAIACSGTRTASRPAPAASTPRARSGSATRRKRPAPIEAGMDSEEEQGSADSPATCTNANHNKYCHFCQHVKVRASSMLACENQECCRRFCEHCLQTHLNEDVDPMSSDAWSLVDGKPFWHCPICRKKCCCSIAQCEENHRHCKAYRYRCRRAELATKRTAAASHSSGDKRSKKAAAASAAAARPATSAKIGQTTPTLARPTMTCAFVRPPSIELPLFRPTNSAAAATAFSGSSRPRREAALKRKVYEDEDEGEEEAQSEIKTPSNDDVIPAASQHSHQTPLAQPQYAESGDASVAGMWGDKITLDQGCSSDEEADSMMLGAMYGHMSESLSSLDMCTEDEMLLDDVHLDAELDEARWLRRTYETVYNPAARHRALQALSGDETNFSKGKPREDVGAWKKQQIDKQLFPPATISGPTDPIGPCGDVSDMLASPMPKIGPCGDVSDLLASPMPKAPRSAEATSARKMGCTVVYNVV